MLIVVPGISLYRRSLKRGSTVGLQASRHTHMIYFIFLGITSREKYSVVSR